MSKIEITNDTRVIRHRTPARISHWMLVICFFMTMFTGVAFFFPDFAWLTEILGTPQIARGNGDFACYRHHYVASILLALLLNPSIAYCDSTPLRECLYVVHRYFSAHVYGVLGERLNPRHRGRLGNGSLGEKTPSKMVSRRNIARA